MLDDDFAGVVERHSRSLHAYARAVCRDPWIAEDAVQETLLRAWRYRDTFGGRGSLEGWLLRICHNCIVDVLNREGTRTEPLDDDQGGGEPPDESPELLLLLDLLPASQREVVALCGILGFDYESAAAILDVPIGTVRSRLSRARGAMKDAFIDSNEASA